MQSHVQKNVHFSWAHEIIYQNIINPYLLHNAFLDNLLGSCKLLVLCKNHHSYIVDSKVQSDNIVPYSRLDIDKSFPDYTIHRLHTFYYIPGRVLHLEQRKENVNWEMKKKLN